MPFVVSSNWLSWGLGLTIFVLYESLAIIFRGWQDVVSRWKANIGVGLLATFGGYVLLFAYSAIITTYNDHHDSTGRWQAVVNEKNNLKTMLQQRDESLRTSAAKLCPSCETPHKSESLHIQMRYYGMENNAKLEDGRAGRVILVLGLTNKPISPIDVNLICDRNIAPMNSAPFVGSAGMYMNPAMVIVDNHTLELKLTSPAWTPEQPLGMPIFVESDDVACQFKLKQS